MSELQSTTEVDGSSVIEWMAQKIGITGGSKYIYGDPIERNGVTVITVAKALYGFKSGSGKNLTDNGAGDKGAAVVKPVGYIEIKDGSTRFRPVRDWFNLIPLLTTAAPVILLSTWGVIRLLESTKGRQTTER